MSSRRIRALVLVLAVAAAATSAAQISGPPAGPKDAGVEPEFSTRERYGPPEPVDLSTLALWGENYQDRNVVVRGRVGPIGLTQFVLSEAGARVLLIPAHGLDASELRKVASRVEVTGVVRRIRPKEYVRGVDLDLLEHPGLPVLPAPEPRLPPFTITAFSVSDASRGTREDSERPTLAELVDEPAAHAGRDVRVPGRFRGRNLFGDLPAGSEPPKDAWVLKDDTGAVWVVGKPPKGKGWALDPTYPGDARHWIEVTGRLETCGGGVCLRAKALTLVPAPKAERAQAP